MRQRNRSLELSVGIFLVVTAVILVLFILVLGNFRFSPGHQLWVQFNASGGLRDGAKVKVAGVAAGKVKGVEFLDGSKRSLDGRRIWVRVELEIEPAMATAVTSTAQFFITSEGMLGEQYVEVLPGDEDGSPLPSGAEVAGQPVMQMPEATKRAMEMFDRVEELLQGTGGDLSAVTGELRAALEKSNRILARLDTELPSLLEEVRAVVSRADGLVEESTLAVQEGRTWMKDPAIRQTVDHVNESMGVVNQRLPGLLEELDKAAREGGLLLSEGRATAAHLESELTGLTRMAHGVLGRADAALAGVDTKALVEEVGRALERVTDSLATTGGAVQRIVLRTESLVDDLGEMVEGVKKGRGTVGAFLMSRDLYDDIREMVLDLKRNPWKVLWKP